ncbi:MAG: (2Fe-2S)-binding protein [Acidobacteriia bacterium]|nr:(2Fe-2S)-binding protein [Terriglobia bacterium]
MSEVMHCLLVNGREHLVRAWPMERLLDVLRLQLGLTGVKEGCGEGECGACSVILDGQLVNSCLIPVLQAYGCAIRTIEGLALDDALNAIQQAFVDEGGAQCGICTPGMILAAVNLLDRNPEPDEGEIREGLAGNLCRCTGYSRIVESVMRAAKREGRSPRHQTGEEHETQTRGEMLRLARAPQEGNR